jgi:hypothetical protein
MASTKKKTWNSLFHQATMMNSSRRSTLNIKLSKNKRLKLVIIKMVGEKNGFSIAV